MDAVGQTQRAGVPDLASPGHAELLLGERALLEKIVRDAPLDIVLAEMVETMERLLPGVLVSVLVADPDGRHLRHGAAPSLPAFYNQAIDGIAVGEGVGSCGTAAHRRAPVVVADIATDPFWTDFHDLAARAGLAACWSTPLLAADGVLLGTFTMYHRVPRRPGRSDLELSAAFARTAGLAIERQRIRQARFDAEAREQAARNDLAFILEAGAEVSRNLDQQQTLQRLAGLLVPAVAPMCVVHFQEAGRIQRIAAAAATPGAEKLLVDHVNDVVDRVLSTGQTEARLQCPGESETWRELGVTGHVCIPLSELGRPFGTVTLLATAKHPLNERTVALAEEISHHAAVSARHAQQYTERAQLAHDLQAGLLLRDLPNPPGAALATSYSPAGEGLDIGGDFYDIFPLNDGRWAFVIGDVCGRGARAAGTTGLVRHTFRAVARLLNEPQAVVNAVNAALLDRSAEHGTGFVTVVYGQFRQTDDGLVVDLLRAGHLPPMVRRADQSVEEILDAGRALGVRTELNLVTSSVRLHRGDSLVLVTDGVTEARNRDGEQFGEERLAHALAAVHAQASRPELLIEAIDTAVIRFVGNVRDTSDDSAALVITAT